MPDAKKWKMNIASYNAVESKILEKNWQVDWISE